MTTKKGRPATGRPGSTPATKSLAGESIADDSVLSLFDAVVEAGAYGRTTRLVPSEYITGPGPRPATTGPAGAAAPHWWWAEAERVVLALVASGHQVTSDDLHDRFPTEPSATGAAYGGLLRRLAAAGRIVDVGWVRSRRPEARGRRVVLWGQP